MKIARLAPFFLIGSLSILSHAEVSLLADDYIKVTAINGDAVNQSLFQRTQQSFNLQPGRHVITARYERLYDLPGDNHEVVRSPNITLDVNLADNQTYQLSMPQVPEHYEDAKQYIKSPKLAVMQGGQIIAEKSSTARSGGLLSGLGSMFGRGDAVNDNQQVVAALPSAQTTTVTPAIQSDNTLDNFMQLWLQATPEERQKIREWIK